MPSISTKVLPESVLELVKRNPTAYRLARSVRTRAGSLLPPRSVEGIPGRIHPNDFMFDGADERGIRTYVECAHSAIDIVEEGLRAAGRTVDDVDLWLDFGAGYGRVIRHLVQRVDPARVAVTDVITEAVDFCSEEFGVTAVHSTQPLSKLRLGRFDCVYAISVLTHLPEDLARDFLEMTHRLLNPGGVFVFTSHGVAARDNPHWYGPAVEQQADRIRREFEEQGHSYVPYTHYGSEGYGMAWHREDHVRRTMEELHGTDMELVSFQETGLDNHQDVWVYRRAAATS